MNTFTFKQYLKIQVEQIYIGESYNNHQIVRQLLTCDQRFNKENKHISIIFDNPTENQIKCLQNIYNNFDIIQVVITNTKIENIISLMNYIKHTYHLIIECSADDFINLLTEYYFDICYANTFELRITQISDELKYIQPKQSEFQIQKLKQIEYLYNITYVDQKSINNQYFFNISPYISLITKKFKYCQNIILKNCIINVQLLQLLNMQSIQVSNIFNSDDETLFDEFIIVLIKKQFTKVNIFQLANLQIKLLQIQQQEQQQDDQTEQYVPCQLIQKPKSVVIELEPEDDKVEQLEQQQQTKRERNLIEHPEEQQEN